MRLVCCGSPDGRHGLGGEGFGLLCGSSVGPGDAFQHSPDALVVGGVGVAVGLVDGGDGGAVESYRGHREAALLHQVGEVGGHQGWGGRHGQGGAGPGPLGEGLPGGAVTGPGVFGGAAIDELADALDVGGAQALRSCGEVLRCRGDVGRQEGGVLLGHGRLPWPWQRSQGVPTLSRPRLRKCSSK